MESPHTLRQLSLQWLLDAINMLPLAILLAALLFAGWLLRHNVEIDRQPAQQFVATVNTHTVHTTTEVLYVDSQGTVQPSIVTPVISQVSGKIVWMSPAMTSGGRFSGGEKLIQIERADYKNDHREKAAAVLRAEARYEFSIRENDRVKLLYRQLLVSESALESSLQVFKTSEADVAIAIARLERAARSLDRTAIYAPYAGYVRTEFIEVEQFVGRGQEIAVIYASDPVEIRLPISSRDIPHLDIVFDENGLIPAEIAPKVFLSASFENRSRSWEGRLARTDSELDVSSRMLFVVATLPQQKGDQLHNTLISGLFVEARIQGKTVEGVVRLPRMALRGDNRVLIVDDNDQLRFREVTIIKSEGDTVIVKDGLREGEVVCLCQLDVVVEGMRVSPLNG